MVTYVGVDRLVKKIFLQRNVLLVICYRLIKFSNDMAI